MRIRLLFSALLLSMPARLHAQSVDDIISKYAQRIGGSDRLAAIQSVRHTGKLYGGGGFEAQLRYERKRPNKVREEFAFGGMTGVKAFDGNWKRNSSQLLRLAADRAFAGRALRPRDRNTVSALDGV